MKKQLIFLSVAVFLVSAYSVFQFGLADLAQGAQHAEVSFANDIRPLLQNRCASCHTGKFVNQGLDMGTYDSLMAGSEYGPVIVPGDANGSLLVEKVTSGEMPKRGPKLTPAQIALIVDWINAGAPDN